MNTLLCALRRVSAFFRHCWTECPLRMRCSVLIISALLNLLLFCLVLPGCATTQTGLDREQALYQIATNVANVAQPVTAVLPPQASIPAQFGWGVIAALLAAWNLHQQAALKKLKQKPSIPPPQPAQPQTQPFPPPA